MSVNESSQEYMERMRQFIKNRAAFPQEELAKYVDQWIAWSPDGTAIIAHSAESEEAVYQQLDASEYDASQCCVSYVPGPEGAIFGGLDLCGALNKDQPHGREPPKGT